MDQGGAKKSKKCPPAGTVRRFDFHVVSSPEIGYVCGFYPSETCSGAITGTKKSLHHRRGTPLFLSGSEASMVKTPFQTSLVDTLFPRFIKAMVYTIAVFPNGMHHSLVKSFFSYSPPPGIHPPPPPTPFLGSRFRVVFRSFSSRFRLENDCLGRGVGGVGDELRGVGCS